MVFYYYCNAKEVAFILVIFFSIMLSTRAQLDVLAVSSYRACVEVDPSVAINDNGGLGNFLNCTPSEPGKPLPLVTTIDLRLTPNIETASSFIVKLTVVRGDSTQPPSSDPTACDPENPTTQLCTATLPTRITIDTTKMKFRYELEKQQNLKIPYAYMSATEFIDSSISNNNDNSNGCLNLEQCYGMAIHSCKSTSIEKTPTSADAYCAQLKNVLLGQTVKNSNQKIDPILNLWQRFNKMPFTTFLKRDSDSTRNTEMTWISDDSGTGFGEIFMQCDYANYDVTDNSVDQFSRETMNNVLQGNLNHFMNRRYDSSNLMCFTKNNLLENLLGDSGDHNYDVGMDPLNIDIRTGVFRPIPGPEGMIPGNIYQVNDLSTTEKLKDLGGNVATLSVDGCTEKNDAPFINITKVPGLESPTHQHDITIVSCASARCAANSDERLDVGSGGTFRGKLAYSNSMNTFMTLDPQCSVYKVNPVPQVLVETTIKIETLEEDGKTVNRTESITIDNFSAGNRGSSPKQSNLIRGRIENVESLNVRLGPTIDGFIVVCGRENAGTDVGFVDMRHIFNPYDAGHENGTLNSQVVNPWFNIVDARKHVDNTIKNTNWNGCRCPEGSEDHSFCNLNFNVNDPKVNETTDCCYPKWKNIFPHPSDYSPLGKYGKTDNGINLKGLPGDKGATFWYYVSKDDAEREFGTGCNQVGLKTNWFVSPQNVQNFCDLPPHECTPGVGRHFNGGLKTTVPANVASIFLRASGAMRFGTAKGHKNDDNTITWPQEENIFKYLNTTPAEELKKALKFMPNDPFAADDQYLYNPLLPNFWLSGPGFGLIYDPFIQQKSSKSSIFVSSARISSELVIDLVGSFVGYTSQVAKAEIVINKINDVDGEHGQECIKRNGDGNITMSIKNLSLPPFSTVDGDYILTVDCRPDVTGIGVRGVTYENGSFTEGNSVRVQGIKPNTTSPLLEVILKATGTGVTYLLPQDMLFCWANLTSAVSSLALNIDAKKVQCNVSPPQENPYSGIISPNVTQQPGDTAEECGCWDFKCNVEVGEIYNSCSFWTFTIIMSAVSITFVALLIKMCIYATNKRTESSRIIQKSKRMEKKEKKARKERRIQRILKKDGKESEGRILKNKKKK